MNETAAFAVADASAVAEPRRVLMWLADRLAFSEERAGRAALVVSEMATNLAKHARGGEILLRVLTTTAGESDGIEIVALDKGPGMPDVAVSRRDGHSTAGSLGHGLGAIERQSDFFELYTHTTGTVMVAHVLRDPAARGSLPLYEVAAAHVSKPGEEVCGDAWSWRLRADRLAVLIADGLGHGPAAHEAAEVAVRVFSREHEEHPARIVEDLHAALRPTRGAAVAVLSADLERGTIRYAGLGNIAGAILPHAGGRHNLVSHSGTAGHTAGRIQEFNYPLPRQSVLVLHSDGMSTHWDLEPYPGLRRRSASIIAALLYRDFSRRRDDVTVVVVKERTGASNLQ